MSKTVYVQDYYTVIEQFYNGVVEPKMQLEELIGEMSLFEKCSLEIDKSYLPNITSKQIKMLLEQYQKIIFYVEIVDISKTPHLN